jgi:ribosomal protein S27AE
VGDRVDSVLPVLWLCAAAMTGLPAPRTLCPRCGSEQIVNYGAQIGCGHCGRTWQADTTRVAVAFGHGRDSASTPDAGVMAVGRHRAPEVPEPREPLDDVWDGSWGYEPGDVGTAALRRLPEAVYRARERYLARRCLDERAEQ